MVAGRSFLEMVSRGEVVRGRCSIFSQLPDQSKEAQVGSFEAVRVLKYKVMNLSN
jgi:hypothetical protein